MDSKIIEKALEEVPLEIRAAVKPLSKDKAWAVYIVLLKKEELRFNEIKSHFKAESPGEIDRILKSLAAAGLIAKRAHDFNDLGNPTGYVYRPTNLGKSVIEALFHGVFDTHKADNKHETKIKIVSKKNASDMYHQSEPQTVEVACPVSYIVQDKFKPGYAFEFPHDAYAVASAGHCRSDMRVMARNSRERIKTPRYSRAIRGSIRHKGHRYAMI